MSFHRIGDFVCPGLDGIPVAEITLHALGFAKYESLKEIHPLKVNVTVKDGDISRFDSFDNRLQKFRVTLALQ